MHKPIRKIITMILTLLVTGMLLSVCVYAQEKEAEKYVKEIRFVLGESQEEAAAWLRENGYEPIPADGVYNKEASDVRILMPGIKRTADPDKAVSDLSVFAFGGADAADSAGPDELTALYTVAGNDTNDPVLADSIVVRYGDDEMPEGCSRMLTLTPFETADSKEAAESIFLFWNTEKGEESDLSAAVFSDGRYVLIATAGLMLGIIGATIFLLPRRKKEERPEER